MSIKLTLKKINIKSNKSYKKWFAKVVNIGEVHTKDLAKKIHRDSAFSEGAVVGVINDFIQQMKYALEDGQVVVIDGLGRFSITVESEGVEDPRQFRFNRHIKKLKTRFQPAGKRNFDHTITFKMSEDAKVDWAPGIWDE